MEDKTNTIELIGIKKTRPVLSCVRHHIERWVERQQTLLFYPKSSSYRVTITHEPDAPVFTCEVQINIGSTRWTGCESGKTLQGSVELTLTHLRRDPPFGLMRFTPNPTAHILR